MAHSVYIMTYAICKTVADSRKGRTWKFDALKLNVVCC